MFYQVVLTVAIVYIRVLYRFQVEGSDNIPDEAPFIVCANHINWQDPLAVGAAIARHHRIHFMAKRELFSYPLFGALLRRMGAFPVRRWEADYVAFRRACALLDEGLVPGLFPEGSRSKTGFLQQAQNGAAMLALSRKVPILPVAIISTYRPLRPLRIVVGPTFCLVPLTGKPRSVKKEHLVRCSARIMDHIAGLMNEDGSSSAAYQPRFLKEIKRS